MRYFLILISLVITLGGPLSAQDQDIKSVIGAQLEAFKADDFGRAFTYASPSIQGIFGTPKNFGRMVRQGYPMVYRPSDIRFLELREEDGMLWQRVQLTDQQGRLHLLDYQMVQQEKGWKINAVELLRAPEANV